MSELLSAEIVARLVGVIDLLGGRAVHAVAGKRDRYRAVQCCDGDPQALVDQYRNLGITRLYLADLDAITAGQIQFDSIDAICRRSADTQTLVDIGWTGDEDEATGLAIANRSAEHPQTLWVSATESATSFAALQGLAARVGPGRVLLGLDYRGGELITAGNQERDWIDCAMRIGCAGAVILDLATVGTARGPSTVDICQRVRRAAPTLQLYSGGGLRSAQDVRLLIDAGCDRCLVATALHRLMGD